MGKVAKGIKCSVAGCEKVAVKSVSPDLAVKAQLNVSTIGRRAYLCKDHWREVKKRTKRDRKLEKWSRGLP